MQRNGMPLPPGITDVLGLEVSGTVVAQGAGVESPAIGAPVMALLNGGGYADYCVARAELCLSVPKTCRSRRRRACRKRRLPCGITCSSWGVCNRVKAC